MYSKLINKKGKIIIMSGYFKFEQELPTFWQTSIFDSFRKNNLSFETYFIDKDIDLRKKFPELNKMRGREKNADQRTNREAGWTEERKAGCRGEFPLQLGWIELSGCSWKRKSGRQIIQMECTHPKRHFSWNR